MTLLHLCLNFKNYYYYNYYKHFKRIKDIDMEAEVCESKKNSDS